MSILALFDTELIRKEWYENERWFSVVGIIAYLTDSDRPRKYRSDLKSKMNKYEWFIELSAKIGQLKFVASDGKKYLWDAVNTETALRIIQSIPSPKAEPLKRRLAELGNQRFEEYEDPELGIQRANHRAILKYKSMGMSDEEIKQRMEQISIRKDFTELIKIRWWDTGYGILTNIWYERTGMTAEQYKLHKGLKSKCDNLRDHQTKLEMLLTTVSEEASKEIILQKDMKWFDNLQTAVKQGANVAKKTKEELESYTGKEVVSSENRLSLKQKKIRRLILGKSESIEE